MNTLPFADRLSEEEIHALGITRYGIITTDQIEFSDEVRKLCADNVCGNYCKTWACPPAVGTVEECKARILSYPRAFVFSSVYQLEDSFDYEGMMEGHAKFKEVCQALVPHLNKPYLLFSNEGCKHCAKCTYPDAPCRFPEGMHPPIEGCGIWVNKLAESAGMPYINGQNTVTYFGMVCYGD